MTLKFRRLTIERLGGTGANYRLTDAATRTAFRGEVRVEWLNVDGAPFSFGGSAADVAAEFGGEHVAVVELANVADDDGVTQRRAAGARITLRHEDEVDGV